MTYSKEQKETRLKMLLSSKHNILGVSIPSKSHFKFKVEKDLIERTHDYLDKARLTLEKLIKRFY